MEYRVPNIPGSLRAASSLFPLTFRVMTDLPGTTELLAQLLASVG